MSGLADPKPARSRKRSATATDRKARLNFKVAVLAVDGRCVAHVDPADCEGDFQAHHAITQGQLRRVGLHDELWNPLNGACVCELAHRRHHRGIQRIGYERLPQRCVDFAERHGLGYLLDRFYPRTP